MVDLSLSKEPTKSNAGSSINVAESDTEGIKDTVSGSITNCSKSKRKASGKRFRGQEQNGAHYEEIKRENESFSNYYTKQGIIPEEEWGLFMKTLSTSLPLTFRLTGHRNEVDSTKLQLEKILLSKLGKVIANILEWYRPLGYAWHLETDRKAMRTEDENAEFHKWLVAATENGDISRQEAVSMIPPLFLNVKSEDLVLDMCAAPGSKTAQIVESMHLDAKMRGIKPTGLVVANDSDQQRAYMLYHQVKRILSPCLLVSNNDGTSFPTLVRKVGEKFERVLFDSILADVPCSGDGTLRKNVTLWKTWNPNQALGLHPLQVRLLEKAIRLVKVGGRIVYSTCSMNAVENEAVIAHVLSKYQNSLELVDVSGELCELVRRPGMSSWKIFDKDGFEYKSPEEVPKELVKRFPPSLFPKTCYENLHLERCLRIYPHLQNTGGFFIAIIVKKASITTNDGGGGTSEEAAPPTKMADTKLSPPLSKKKHSQSFKATNHLAAAKVEGGGGEFRHLNPSDEAVLDNIFEWYGIDKDLIIEEGFGFLVRSEREPIKVITLVSPSAEPVLAATVTPHRIPANQKGEGGVELYNQSLKIVNVGVRAFELYESSRPVPVTCPYRLLSESIGVLRPYMTKRIVKVTKEILTSLLSSQDSLELKVEGGEELLSLLGQGGAVLETQLSNGNIIMIPVWKSERGFKAFVPNPNRPAILSQLA